MYFIGASLLGMVADETNGRRRNRQPLTRSARCGSQTGTGSRVKTATSPGTGTRGRRRAATCRRFVPLGRVRTAPASRSRRWVGAAVEGREVQRVAELRARHLAVVSQLAQHLEPDRVADRREQVDLADIGMRNALNGHRAADDTVIRKVWKYRRNNMPSARRPHLSPSPPSRSPPRSSASRSTRRRRRRRCTPSTRRAGISRRHGNRHLRDLPARRADLAARAGDPVGSGRAAAGAALVAGCAAAARWSCSCSPTVAWLLAARAVQGLATGGAPARRCIDLHPRGDAAHAGLVNGIVSTSSGIGAGAIVSAILVAAAPAPRALPFVVVSALIIVALVAVWRSPSPRPCPGAAGCARRGRASRRRPAPRSSWPRSASWRRGRSAACSLSLAPVVAGSLLDALGAGGRGVHRRGAGDSTRLAQLLGHGVPTAS